MTDRRRRARCFAPGALRRRRRARRHRRRPSSTRALAGRAGGRAHAGRAGRACRALARARWWCWRPSDDAGSRRACRARGERGWVARCGGATRAATRARTASTALRERGARDDDWVLVHDAARCLLRAGVGRPR
ncbi:MAG: hypothetical protein MZW92_70160 [Comamonadaceae bacterium]|nr:hypothetical protein [Comamonadaceae bacterium]